MFIFALLLLTISLIYYFFYYAPIKKQIKKERKEMEQINRTATEPYKN
jgi:preprotein translocase subunit YajC